jgi:hypothetical protein
MRIIVTFFSKCFSNIIYCYRLDFSLRHHTEGRPSAEGIEDFVQEVRSIVVVCLHLDAAVVHEADLRLERVGGFLCRRSRLRRRLLRLEQSTHLVQEFLTELTADAGVVGVSIQPSAARVRPEIFARFDAGVHIREATFGCPDALRRQTVAFALGVENRLETSFVVCERLLEPVHLRIFSGFLHLRTINGAKNVQVAHER